MKRIDLSTWERTTHYEFFKRMDYPHHSICVNLDITKFLKTIKNRELPLYYSLLFLTTSALNTVEEFRYRMREDGVVLHEKVHPSFTDMEKGTELFKMVTVPLESTIEDFIKAAREKSDRQKAYFVAKDVQGRDDLIYFSCSPWVSFTGLTHTISFNKYDSIPRIAWGKYFEDGNKTLLPFSVQAHHSFVDGLHMGRYIDCVQEYLDCGL